MNLRKLVAVATSSLLALTVLAGCGSGGGGSAEKFCEIIKTVDDVSDSDPAAQVAKMRELANAAPDKKLKEDLTYLADALDEMANLDFTDEAAMAAFEEKIDEERLNAVTESLESRGKDLCPDLAHE